MVAPRKSDISAFALIITVAVCSAIGISCKKSNPVTPPATPSHTALALEVTFTSTRWCRLQWGSDSIAASRRYVLIRDNRDTLYNDSMAAGIAVKVLQDTVLRPGMSYVYWVYRIVNGQRWDSATVNMRTLDTTSDNMKWGTMLRIGKPGSFLIGISSTGPRDTWMSGSIQTDTGVFELIHVMNDRYTYFDLQSDIWMGGCYASCDSSVWVCGNATLYHWDRRTITSHGTWNDSFPSSWTEHFRAVWESSDRRNVMAVGTGGLIIHRDASGKWEKMPSETAVPLLSMRAFSASDVYVAGGNDYEGDLLHFDGSSWDLILRSVPPDSSVNVAMMSDVWGSSADSLWVVGNGVYHRHDGNWQNRTPGGNGAYVEGLNSVDWNNAFACGDFGLLMHYNGERWTHFSDYFDFTSDMIFSRVLMEDNGVYVVGHDGQSAVVLRGSN